MRLPVYRKSYLFHLSDNFLGYRMTKLAVFDLDGTLVDSRQDLAIAMNCMRESFGLPPVSLDAATTFIGGGIKNLVQKATADAKSEIDQSLALERMKNFYTEHLVDTTRLFENVAEVLHALHKQNFILAIVSNKDSKETTSIIKHLGIYELFSDIIGGDSQFPLKPEPDSLLYLAKKYSLSPKNCWMIGDHYTDLESGRRAGFKRIFCTYGFGEQRGENPDYTADSFAQTADILSDC